MLKMLKFKKIITLKILLQHILLQKNTQEESRKNIIKLIKPAASDYPYTFIYNNIKIYMLLYIVYYDFKNIW